MLVFVASAWSLVEFGLPSSRAESVARFCSEPSLPLGEDPPAFKVRLGISRTSITPGGDLRVRVENLGTESVTYGYEYRLERRRGNSWVKLPVGPFYASKLSAEGARAGPCEQVEELERKAVPGLYRISKTVWPSDASRTDARLVRAKFQVRGS
jgi:hypothetical protein